MYIISSAAFFTLVLHSLSVLEGIKRGIINPDRA